MNLKIRIVLLAICVTLTMGGCSFSVGPESSLPDQTEWLSIDFEKFRVDAHRYPKFHAKRSIFPPSLDISFGMTEIMDKDVWEIRYRLNDFYLVFSESFNDRQCRFIIDTGPKSGSIAHVSPFTGKCRLRYLYCIVVDLKGNVTRGWELVHNPEVVVSTSARAQSFKPFARQVGDWGAQPLFRTAN